MANFGFARLAVVAPYDPHWQEARSAVGAGQLLASAAENATLAEAVAQCTMVLGTGTLAYRKPEQKVVRLPDLAPIVRREIEQGGRVALVFGPEKHGLTRENLSFCHLLVEIPTDPMQPSMNLGQAVAVCLFELAARVFDAQSSKDGSPSLPRQKKSATIKRAHADADPEPASGPSAATGRLELLAGVIERAMVASNYSPASMRDANRHDLRLLLRRLAPSERDARRILGLFRRIIWRLKQ